jgi:hypothetical protein
MGIRSGAGSCGVSAVINALLIGIPSRLIWHRFHRSCYFRRFSCRIRRSIGTFLHQLNVCLRHSTIILRLLATTQLSLDERLVRHNEGQAHRCHWNVKRSINVIDEYLARIHRKVERSLNRGNGSPEDVRGAQAALAPNRPTEPLAPPLLRTRHRPHFHLQCRFAQALGHKGRPSAGSTA